MISASKPSISHSDVYVKPVSQNEIIEAYHRVAACSGKKELTIQSPYYLTPFSGHSTPLAECLKVDSHPVTGGLCANDYPQPSVSPVGNVGPERSHYFPLSQLKGQLCGYPTYDKYYSRSTDAPSMSSFSDDACESGATTPASERSTHSSSGISRRSSLMSVSNDGTSKVFYPQAGGGSYYSQQQLQQPHYITAS